MAEAMETEAAANNENTNNQQSSSGAAAAAAAAGGKKNVPWVEKYRPSVLSDVVGNETTIERLRAVAIDGNMPNVIVSGPPGTGKTTSILCLAHELLGPNYRDAVLELNASDDRGINVVRGAIKNFAQKKVTLPPGKHKIVILDEADSMTPGAQQTMRRTMEKYAATTRFALACNVSTKIIEPIQSRCAILRFTKLTDEQILKRVMEVAAAEHVTYTDDGLDAIIFTAEGDMRQALNNMQATFSGFAHVNQENVFKVCDQPHPVVLKELVRLCTLGELDGAHGLMCGLWNDGYSSVDIVGTLFRVVKSYPMSEYMKLLFLKEIGFCHMRSVDGLNTLVQLSGLVAKVCQIALKVRNEKGPFTVQK